MRKITLIMAYYENPGMLKKQQEIIEDYPIKLKENLDIIIIDDCSPEKPASRVFKKIYGVHDMRLYRTKIDVPWNQDFCRNLGANQATTEWLLLTDMDHIIPVLTISSLMCEVGEHPRSQRFCSKTAYRFSRRDYPSMKPYKMHPNSWFMSNELWKKVGGYDERFAGYYGTDGDFRDRILKHASICQLQDIEIIRVGREYIPDASTTTYKRKKPEDGIAIRDIKNKRGIKARPHTLTFEWERLV